MKPLLVLVLLPLLIGVGAEAIFRDTRRASFVALAGAVAATCIAVQILDPRAAWNWLAAILVSPLPMAIAVAAAMASYDYFGKSTVRRQ